MQGRLLLNSAYRHVEHLFASELPPEFTYHDFSHTLQVCEAVNQLSEMAGISSDNRMLLMLAAIFHDVGYIEGAELHEERSAEMAGIFLSDKGMEEKSINQIQEMIRDTGFKEYRSLGLSDYLRDADLSYLGLPGFFERADLFRAELLGTGFSGRGEKDWLEFNLSFFKRHSFITQEAKLAYNPLKRQHQSLLEAKLRLCAG